jgi:hypothetical protein
MVRWNVVALAKDKGWENANQLARGAGLSYPVASRVMESEPLERIDVSTLERLALALDMTKTPWKLLAFDPPKRSR